MSDRVSRVEERLRQLDEAVSCLSRRLEQLERRGDLGPHLVPAAETADGGAVQLSSPPRSDAVTLLSLAGRTCLVFGGAYLLRALTESGHLPATIGVLLGLLYALGWLAAADRAQPSSALFHGIATVLIGFPIVWEAASRFQFLSPSESALALAGIVGPALAVAWHRRLPALAGLAVVGALATSLALPVVLDQYVPFATLLVGIGGVVLWAAYHRRWTWLAVLAALAADLAVLAVLARAVWAPPHDAVGAALALQITLLAVYLGSFAVRAFARSPLGPFEYVQGSLVLGVGLGGTIALTHGDVAMAFVGAATAACAGLAYWVGFGSLRHRGASTATIHFFSSLGLVLTLVAGRLLLAHAWYAIALSVFAMAAVAFGRRIRSGALMLHAAFALTAAAVSSGLPTLVARVWFLPVSVWPPISAAAWGVIAATVICFIFWLTRREAGTAVFAGERTAVGALMVAGLGTFAAISIGQILAEIVPAAGVPTIVKSLVLAISTLFLGWTRRVPQLADLSRLTYPVLIAGGVKILLQDLPSAQPAALFVMLALYGASLIVTPTVLRGRDGRRPAST